MSGLGGFAPLPIRLGGSATEGWTASQHARFAADLVALSRVVPVAVLTYTVSAGTITLHSYRGVNGVGSTHAPTITSPSTGVSVVTFNATYENARGHVWAISVRDVDPAAHGTTAIEATPYDITPTSFKVRTNALPSGTLVDGKVSVWVYSDRPLFGRAPRIGDYDGALDKDDTRTERIPYAWVWYQEYESMLGSGFATERTTHVHVRKLALARCEAAVTRAAEKLGTNQIPGTSDDALGDWVRLLRVPLRGTENRQEIRQLCADSFEISKGNDKASVDEAIEALLGDSLLAIVRQYGSDLANPPAYTLWPGVNPGPSEFDLGGGTWLSERSFIIVQVEKPSAQEESEFLFTMNVRLFRLLDDLLPAWATFGWATGTDGFILDVSEVDYDGL